MSNEPKTKPTDQNVDDYLATINPQQRQQDAKTLITIMQKITGKKPVMWGTKIIGFGEYHYKYKSGHEGDWPLTGFAISKQGLTLYIMSGFSEYDSLLKKLGNHKLGKSCLYLKSLDNIDIDVLTTLIKHSVDYMKKTYECN